MTFVVVQPVAIDRDAVRPSVEDVAALERTRTYDMGDIDLTTFTEDTRPTADEVDLIIDGAVEDVLGRLPDRVLPGYGQQIRRLITLAAAVSLEGSYFREQAGTGPVALWQAQLVAGLADLKPLLRSGIL